MTKRQIHLPGGGGGAGSLALGPDFGEASGNDGVTARATALLTMPTLGVTRTQEATAALTIPNLAISAPINASGHLSASVLGAPFWQSVATTGTVGSTFDPINIAKPSGTVEGDLLLAHLSEDGAAVITPPAGWTLIRNATSPGLIPVTAYTFYKIAGASEPASYDFTTDDQLSAGEIHRIIGAHATTPINVSAIATLNATALDPDPDSPAVTTTVNNCLYFRFLAHDHAAVSQTHTEASGTHVERTDFNGGGTSNRVGQHSMTRVLAVAGSTAGAVHNCTETAATDAVMTTVAIAPASLVLAA